MISDEADEVITELFDLLKNRYQSNLQSMRGSEFVLDYAQLLYYQCHKVNLNGGGSYIDSLYWINNKKATIDAINKKITNVFHTLYKSRQIIKKWKKY